VTRDTFELFDISPDPEEDRDRIKKFDNSKGVSAFFTARGEGGEKGLL
jgi:hypothetical protein